MTGKTAKEVIIISIIFLMGITFFQNLGRAQAFFFFEARRIKAQLTPPLPEGYVIKGELKENCFFIFYPPDGNPPRNIQNSGYDEGSGKILLSITDEMNVKPHFAYLSQNDKPPYWEWNYKFVVDPDGRVTVLEPTGFNIKRDHFVCP